MMSRDKEGGGIFDLPPEDRRHLDAALKKTLEPEPPTGDQVALLEARLTQLKAGERVIPWLVAQRDMDWDTEKMQPRAVELLESAQTDLHTARDAFEAEREGLGQTFLGQIDQELGRICKQPMVADFVVPGLCRVGLLSFPYSIVYRIDDGTVQVVAVMRHTRRIDVGSPQA